jgi:D-serine deaminase-like pyridoxal phosphate-dependent protein
MNHWYEIENPEQVDSPALLVYPDRVKENIRILKRMIDDPLRLRPHVKTNKCKEAAQLMMQAGIHKFKCATIAEAEMLGMCKAADVLLAYQPVGPKLQRFIALIKKYSETKFSCLTDNKESAKEMSDEFIKNKLTVAVYIDLNVGQNRTGIEPGEKGIGLYKYCAEQKARLNDTVGQGITPVGLHAYDGHLHQPDIADRTRESNLAFSRVEAMVEKLKSAGFPEPVIVAGGSPTFPIHAKRKNIECSPGTFIYWDKGYLDNCAEQAFLNAAVVLARIISLPAENKICIDLGHKSIAAENELNKRVYFLNAPELKFISHSEEHLVAETNRDHSYKPGKVLYGLPWHICPTVSLYERAYTVENKKLSGEWKTIARDRKISL